MPPDPSSPQAWVDYARSDLALARADHVAGVMREALCFHAQQAAEKGIKAVLLSRSVAFPRTHSIELLISLLPADIRRTPDLLQSAVLTEYATVPRYPGGQEPVTEQDYRRLLALAAFVVAWAEKLVSS